MAVFNSMPLRLPQDFAQHVAAVGADYFEFKDGSNVVQLWPSTAVEDLNRDHEVEVNVPGMVGFGTDTGDLMFAFDESGAVWQVPFVPMQRDEARRIAGSWSELLSRLNPG